MVRFLGRRLLRAAATLFGVLTLVFLIIRLSGSPAALMLGPEATPEDVATLNRAFGFDKSIPEQYGSFISTALQGDLGESITYRRPAVPIILDFLPATLLLAISSFLAGVVPASILYLISEVRGGRRLRNALLWIGALVQAVPTFLLGVLLILIFAIQLELLPALGKSGFQSLILPTLTLGGFQFALYIRLYSVAFDEQRTQDYVRTAYAKGQSHSAVVLRHILPNAVLPVVTVAGLALGSLIGGTVVVETVFNWPGVGHFIYQAVLARDYPIVQAGVVIVAGVFVFINLLVDFLYAVLDPRVRLS